MDCTHIILKAKSLKDTQNFYEKFFELKNHSRIGFAIKIGSFTLGFEEQDLGAISENGIEHIGILLQKKTDVDSLYRRFVQEGCKASDIIGGPGEGPYRFYVKDPNSYNLEFETWDGASD